MYDLRRNSMKIEQINALPAPSIAGGKTEAQISPRERAIQRLMDNQAPQQTTPVQNPSSVAPEEMTAVTMNTKQEAPKSEFEKAVESATKGQNDSSEEAKPAEEAKPSEPLSSQYATLARREKLIRQQAQQLKAREQALKAAEEAAKAPAKPAFNESDYVRKSDLLEDTFGTLNQIGLGYDKLTEKALNAPSSEQLAFMQEIKRLTAKIEALEGETKSTKQTFEDNQRLARTQAEKQIKNDVSSLVKSDPAFETIAATDSIQDVVDLITRTYDEDGILMSVEDAAREVEEYLVEEALKLSRLNKIQQKLAPKAASEPKQSTAPQQQQIKTLTNSVSSSRPMSAKERAILAFQGKLGK
jgi:hypothetical protein